MIEELKGAAVRSERKSKNCAENQREMLLPNPAKDSKEPGGTAARIAAHNRWA
jgi:hypothetical protein